MTSVETHDITEPQPDRPRLASRTICGFWRRVFAFLIDCTILVVLGYISGFFLFDFYAHLEGWGRLIGLAVASLYFGLLNSSLGKGQTLGKRIMEIEVVNKFGNSINLGRSLLRFAILGAPWYLFFSFNISSISSGYGIIDFLIYGLGVALVYLYIFNRRTRQSLHDLFAGTFVVRTFPKGKLAAIYIWKMHFIIVGICSILVLGSYFAISTIIQRKIPPELIGIYYNIDSLGNLRITSPIMALNIPFLGVALKQKPVNYEASVAAVAREIATMVLNKYPDIMKKDILIIHVCYGYDIGIARSWRCRLFAHTPRKWQEFVNHPNKKIKDIRQPRQKKGT